MKTYIIGTRYQETIKHHEDDNVLAVYDNVLCKLAARKSSEREMEVSVKKRLRL